jgi:hypothetical protein
MAHIQNQTKHDNETKKFHHFSSYTKRNRCWENVFSASENAEIDQFIPDVWIKNFEVIYEEQVMAHIQNHTKHDFES